MKRVNVLITAASRKVALIKSFKRAINAEGCKGKVVSTDTDRCSPASFFADSHHTVPLSSSPEYIDTILDICANEDIHLLVPTIDEELALFGGNKTLFKEKGVVVLTSSRETGDICRDKYLTYKVFKENGFPFAETLLPSEINPSEMKYPLFIKPRQGRGSVEAYPVRDKKELLFFMDYVHDPVIQRFLEGREFTIDVLSDFKGRVLSVVPRERLVIRSGVCDRGITVKDQSLINYGVRIAEALDIVGPANLQCKQNSRGEIIFFEVNPRFSGAIQLTIKAGADFPAMIVNMVNNISNDLAIGDFQDGLTMISYEDSVYDEKRG